MKKNNGFVILVGIIVIGAIGLAVSLILSAIGTAAVSDSQVINDYRQAKNLAEACVEEALQQISDSVPFAGSGTQIVGGEVCNYSVVNLGGSNREVTAWATGGLSTARFEVLIDAIRPSINIVSWQEVVGF
jgi:hypothetical protein